MSKSLLKRYYFNSVYYQYDKISKYLERNRTAYFGECKRQKKRNSPG